MREITRMSWLQSRKQAKNENENQARPYVWLLLGAIGGVISALLGFLLLGIHCLTGRSDALENYGGVALLVFAFVCFVGSSHFMDKAEENRRLIKKPVSSASG